MLKIHGKMILTNELTLIKNFDSANKLSLELISHITGKKIDNHSQQD